MEKKIISVITDDDLFYRFIKISLKYNHRDINVINTQKDDLDIDKYSIFIIVDISDRKTKKFKFIKKIFNKRILCNYRKSKK